MQAVIEINRENLIHNVKRLRSKMRSESLFVAVIKGNAYGHGLKEIVTCIDQYVDGYQVDDVLELLALRTVSRKAAYVLGYVDNDSLLSAMSAQCTLAVINTDQLSVMNNFAAALNIIQPVHIKIDALVGRMGFFEEDIPQLMELFKELPHLQITGIYSHFTGLKDTINIEHTEKQMATFARCVQKIKEAHPGKDFTIHMSSSAGVFISEIRDNELFSLFRVGKAMYGIWPSKEIPETVSLKPVLSWKTQIAQVKEFPSEYPIGYNATMKTSKTIKAAVVPQGYSDGFDKKMSDTGNVLIGGVHCKMIGRVAMNMFLVDVSEVPNVRQGQEVVLIGKQDDELISLESVGNAINATSCEMLVRISPLIPRVII
ncbi:alanine racemase [bacterium]|nr:alanine racemase [bacterium]